MNWVVNDNMGPRAKYKCKTHGDIGKDIVIVQGVERSSSSDVLCHRCLVAMLNKTCKVTEIK